MRTFATLSPMPFCELRTAWVQSPALMPLLPRERHRSQGNGAAPLSNSKLSPRHSHHATRFQLCVCAWMKPKPSERDSALLGADRWSLSRNCDRCSLASGSLAPSSPSVGPTCCEPWLDRTIGARICMALRGGGRESHCPGVRLVPSGPFVLALRPLLLGCRLNGLLVHRSHSMASMTFPTPHNQRHGAGLALRQAGSAMGQASPSTMQVDTPLRHASKAHRFATQVAT